MYIWQIPSVAELVRSSIQYASGPLGTTITNAILFQASLQRIRKPYAHAKRAALTQCPTKSEVGAAFRHSLVGKVRQVESLPELQYDAYPRILLLRCVLEDSRFSSTIQ